MFENCKSLINLNIANFNTENIMKELLVRYNDIESLDLSNFNTKNLVNMNFMFYDCYSLTSIDLSNFNSTNVKDLSYMLYGCSNLASINLSDFIINRECKLENMFLL